MSLDLKLLQGKAVAVLDLLGIPSNAETDAVSKVLSDLLSADLAEVLPMKLVDRQHLQAILQERVMALAGLTTRARALQSGKMVGADYIVVGSLLQFGGSARLDLQVLDVASGAVVTTASETTAPSELLAAHQRLAATVAERLGAGLKRLEWLRKRRPGKNPEALVHAWRAFDLCYFKSDDKSDQEMKKEVSRLIQLAMDLDPENATVLRLNAWVCQYQGKYDEAESLLRQSLKLEPDSYLANWKMTWLLRVKQDDPAQALIYAHRTSELAAPGARIRMGTHIALCLLALNRLDEAEAEARKAVDTTYPSTGGCHALAKILSAQGNFEEAGQWFEKAARRDDQKRSRWFRAKRAYERAGNEEKAMQMLDYMVQKTKAYEYEQLALMRYLARHDPSRAAMYCYKTLDTGEELVDEARALLRQMNMPLQRSLVTGAVFDLEGMRERNVSIVLQPLRGIQARSARRLFGDLCTGHPWHSHRGPPGPSANRGRGVSAKRRSN